MSKLGRYSADRKKVESLSSSKTVTVADCGTLFILAADSVTASLPNASDAGNGWWCKFIMNANIANGCLIAATSGDGDNIHGMTVYTSGSNWNAGTHGDGTGTDAGDSGAPVDVITFHSASSHGDQVELVTDGTSWYVLAHSYHHDAVTFD